MPGQQVVDDICQFQDFNYCSSDAMMYSIGHCRIGPDGVHYIRVSMSCIWITIAPDDDLADCRVRVTVPDHAEPFEAALVARRQ